MNIRRNALFADFYRLLDNGDWEKAERSIQRLENKIGTNDPEINACRVRLTLEQM